MTDDSASTPGAVTQWLLDWGRSDRRALDQMLPVVYEELHRLASHYLSREATGHTLQPTALVHEAYLRLVDQRRVDWRNRAQFLGLAASMMRRILVNHARDRAAQKRGGGAAAVSLSLVEAPSGRPDVELIALEDALQRLAALDERKSRVVELKFFGGLTIEEIAEVLQISGARWSGNGPSRGPGSTKPSKGRTRARERRRWGRLEDALPLRRLPLDS